MRFAVRWSGTTVSLEWEPEDGDPLQSGHARLVGRSARFVLPVALSQTDVHPDVEALLAALIVGPFCKTITFERGVTTQFAEALRTHHDRIATPVDPALQPRRAPVDGHVGLAFSGGADSSAALALLPPDTVACFMDRLDRAEQRGTRHYSASAPLHMCEELARRGRPVLVAQTDLVYARRPVGFTTDWVNAAPLILLADVERLDSLSWGMIAESAYQIGHERYIDWADRQEHYWGALFAAAGLPMAHVVAGVSEVGTAMIVRRWEHGDLVQSCQLGEPNKPCRNCWKCFRKLLLDAALSGDWPRDAEVDHMLRSSQARKMLTHYPIKHENVVAWILRSYPGTHPVLRKIVARTRADEQELGWLERFYGPALDLLGEARREAIRARLTDYLEPMSAEDEARMRAWDMEAFLADPATRAADDKLASMLAAYERPPKPPKPLSRRVVAGIRRRMRG